MWLLLSVFHPPHASSFHFFHPWHARPLSPSLSSLGGEKVNVVKKWGGRWGFPHLHGIGDKNLQTLGNFFVFLP
jgi:hypothetical protein